ncbi:MAG: hypothetical protein AB9903_21865 [Vulcanimicrobiota bacterium]
MEAEIISEKQLRSLSMKILNTIEKRYRIIPLNSLKHNRYSLKKPVFITLENDKDKIIASLDDIEAFSYADTEYEAINGLCEEITNLYEDLDDDRENLGPLPQKWLHYLEELIAVS